MNKLLKWRSICTISAICLLPSMASASDMLNNEIGTQPNIPSSGTLQPMIKSNTSPSTSTTTNSLQPVTKSSNAPSTSQPGVKSTSEPSSSSTSGSNNCYAVKPFFTKKIDGVQRTCQFVCLTPGVNPQIVAQSNNTTLTPVSTTPTANVCFIKAQGSSM